MKEYHQTKSQWENYFQAEMQRLNDLKELKLKILMHLQNSDVGDILMVSRKPGKEYITTISCPRVTTLNPANATYFGGVE
mmetsp:Transcript_40209/g.45763  ORF Transcript_40209/g.45763 Transcript_40209/m.45763 type:complete len:80 (-) Transcript_40209:105-344(-)